MKTKAIPFFLSLVVLAHAWAAPALAVTPESASRPAEIAVRDVRSEPSRPPPFASPEEDRRYAQKEARSQDAKAFRGGSVIVISASALAIVLLIVLLIVLI